MAVNYKFLTILHIIAIFWIGFFPLVVQVESSKRDQRDSLPGWVEFCISNRLPITWRGSRVKYDENLPTNGLSL